MSITGGDVVDLGRGPYAWLPSKRGRGTADCGSPVSPRGPLGVDTPCDPMPPGQFPDPAGVPERTGCPARVRTHSLHAAGGPA
ncbi:hypothetical protein OG279_08225 [Streptomyces sp. NBC_01201]|uniref:hypothetical protein n=1 Tax=unclassified Streptomyces TaxID=2593676 RepID=UPI0021C8F0D5|nr:MULTISPECIES: hypothetical protein [unclassified Streptomyces]WSR09678.1 hypothetical protein OG265_28270 [Streptomyces sp. NBC_01208]WSR47596.1 hypothetical protein OG279_08225 [Streptomyces sp. NBC_01201]